MTFVQEEWAVEWKCLNKGANGYYGTTETLAELAVQNLCSENLHRYQFKCKGLLAKNGDMASDGLLEAYGETTGLDLCRQKCC